VGLISTLGLKYMIDKSLLGKNKGMLDEINDILRMGNVVTRSASNKILSPTLNKMNIGMNKFGRNYEIEYLKDIKQKNNAKILDITSTIKGIIKQMEETKKQISLKYKEKMCA